MRKTEPQTFRVHRRVNKSAKNYNQCNKYQNEGRAGQAAANRRTVKRPGPSPGGRPGGSAPWSQISPRTRPGPWPGGAPGRGAGGTRGSAPATPQALFTPGRREPRGPLGTPRTGLGTQRCGPRAPRPSRAPPQPTRVPTSPSRLPNSPARPVRAAPSSLTTPAPGRAQRSHRRPEPGDLTSGRSRRQRTPSWGSAHPGVTGSRKVRPREARNELCNRQGPQARTEAAARGTSASRARPATQAGSPLATGSHVGAPPPAATAARSRRRHLRSWQPSREARRPAQAQTSRIPTGALLSWLEWCNAGGSPPARNF